MFNASATLKEMNHKAKFLRTLAYSIWTMWAILVLILVFDKSDRIINRNVVACFVISLGAIPTGLICMKLAQDSEKALNIPISSCDRQGKPSKTPLPHA